MNKKTWKPYAAIVLILLYGVDIFWLSGFCVYYFGEWGIPMYEGLLAVLALGIVVLFREDVKRAFPFHRPTIAKTVGTLLMWIGTLLITMIPTSILLYVFPIEPAACTSSMVLPTICCCSYGEPVTPFLRSESLLSARLKACSLPMPKKLTRILLCKIFSWNAIHR